MDKEREARFKLCGLPSALERFLPTFVSPGAPADIGRETRTHDDNDARKQRAPTTQTKGVAAGDPLALARSLPRLELDNFGA